MLTYSTYLDVLPDDVYRKIYEHVCATRPAILSGRDPDEPIAEPAAEVAEPAEDEVNAEFPIYYRSLLLS